MTTYLELDIPVYRTDRYDQLEESGRIKVSSNISSLKEGILTKEYERLKKEIDILITDTNNRTRLAAEISTLEDEIRWKSNNLKNIVSDIERAKQHYDTLLAFLRTVGVDGKQSRFTVETSFLLSPTSEVELSATEKYRQSEF
jgi:predicted  nucleic acid-binding Zn-ribbon protein